MSSISFGTKYNYKIKAAGKTFDIESESAENNLGCIMSERCHGPNIDVFKNLDAPEVKMNKELTVDDLKMELEKLKRLERNLVKKLNHLKNRS